MDWTGLLQTLFRLICTTDIICRSRVWNDNVLCCRPASTLAYTCSPAPTIELMRRSSTCNRVRAAACDYPDNVRQVTRYILHTRYYTFGPKLFTKTVLWDGFPFSMRINDNAGSDEGRPACTNTPIVAVVVCISPAILGSC